MAFSCDAILDIECASWDKFVLGGLLSERGYHCATWESEAKFARRVLEQRGVVWAHFGGGYDLKWLLDWAVEFRMRVIASSSGSRIVSARVGKTIFRDSWALTALSLEELTAGTGVEKSKLPWVCTCERGCGGYCRISRELSPQKMRELGQYLERDCRSLWNALTELHSQAVAEGIELKGTVGSTAWATAEKWLDLGENEFVADKSDGMRKFRFARRGYYGGRVYVGRRFSPSGFEVDIISSYATQLAGLRFPTGPSRELLGASAQRAMERGSPGIFSAVAIVPEMHIPPLPYRQKERIAYPWGKFASVWARPEVDRALELGAKLRCDHALVWDSSDVLFAPFVDRVFAARSRVGRKSAMGEYYKRILNSLSGKLGSDIIHWHLEHSPKCLRDCPCDGSCLDGYQCPEELPEDGRMCNGFCTDGCEGQCGAHVPMGDPATTEWLKRQTVRIDSCSRPHLAAYITSSARVKWHVNAVSLREGRDVAYGDTDSIFSELPRVRDLGNELGDWEWGGGYRDLMVIAPKIHTSKRAGKLKTRAKGISKPGKLLIDQVVPPLGGRGQPLIAGEGIRGIWAGARAGKLFSAHLVTRQLSWGTGDRILNADGVTTRPPHARELQ